MRSRSQNRKNRRGLFGWVLWGGGASSFNAIIITFVCSVHVTDAVASDPERGSQALGIALTIAGACIALIAPVTGQRSDAGGRRKRWLAIHTGIVIACMAGLFFVRDDPEYLLLALVLM